MIGAVKSILRRPLAAVGVGAAILAAITSSSTSFVVAADEDVPGEGVTSIDFVFPLTSGVSRRLIETMDALVSDFNAANADIHVNPIYAGSYAKTLDYVLGRIEEGDPPAVAVLVVNDLVPMIERDAIIALDEYVEAEGGKEYLDDFFEAFLVNSRLGGSLYGMPMMRSTPILFCNMEMLKAAGLDPPKTWEELEAVAKALTTDEVKGVAIADTWTDWIFAAFSRQAGSGIINDTDWTQVTFDNELVRSMICPVRSSY